MKTRRFDPYRVDIEAHDGMRVPGRVFADDVLMADIYREEALKQVANVAHLPGIVGRSLAMPDIHWGYGFPIGGVAAFTVDQGVISPGGVGYDINCGVRLMTSELSESEVKPYLADLLNQLYKDIPTGVGTRSSLKLSSGQLSKVLTQGAAWAVGQGYGQPGDLEHTEDQGAMDGADPETVSDRAVARGMKQLGTLGSGNHFLEVGVVAELFNQEAAAAYGLFKGQITVLIHSGSRGLGYQVCDDYLKVMGKTTADQGIVVPDRQLSCAYFGSPAGQRYFGAMAAAANYAWANRQMMTHWTRETFMKVLNVSPRDLKMNLLYDVAHNIAKKETHEVDGRKQMLVVHRKGATRAFPPGHPDLPGLFRKYGQPVLIPGDMGRASYILAGAEGSMKESFGSCCHGAGRVLSRSAAKRKAKGRQLLKELEKRGVAVRYTGRSTLAEEMPEAYKDVSQVVEVVHQAGLAQKVARLRPIGVIKG